MCQQNHSKKCVLIIDPELPQGLIANTAAVLALTIGNKVDGVIGPDVMDGSEQLHTGITTIPLPILKAPSEEIKEIRNKVGTQNFNDVLVVGFSNAAQTTTDYESYTKKIATFSTNDLTYSGIALYGDKKRINKLTGNLALLR